MRLDDDIIAEFEKMKLKNMLHLGEITFELTKHIKGSFAYKLLTLERKITELKIQVLDELARG